MCDNVLNIPKVFPYESLDKLSTEKYPTFPKEVEANSLDLQIAYEKGFRKGEQISVQNTIISLAHLLRCNKITAGMTNLEIAKLVTEEMKKRYEARND